MRLGLTSSCTNENLKQVDCVFYHTIPNGLQQAFFRIQLQNAHIVETDIGGNALTSNGIHETMRMTFEKIILEDLVTHVVAEDDATQLLQ